MENVVLDEYEIQAQLEALDPNFYKGKGTFKFDNGDLYTGDYCAHRSGIVWREGVGTYTTKDHHVYKGEWRDDKLVENKEIDITYPKGVHFRGYLVKNKYNGPGIYSFDNCINMLCNFSDNKPIGKLILIDIKGRIWHGTANVDDAVFYPEHIFFSDIPDSLGKGNKRITTRKRSKKMSLERSVGSDAELGPDKVNRSKSALRVSKSKMKNLIQVKASKSSQSQSRLQKQLKAFAPRKLSNLEEVRRNTLLREELKIFSKTKKTPMDLQFEDSDWYKNYINFKTVYENIRNKIQDEGENSLDEKEKNWYENYMKFKQRYCTIMHARKNKRNLSQEEVFELISNEDLKAGSVPVPTIYATEDCASVCECKPSDTRMNISTGEGKNSLNSSKLEKSITSSRK